MKYRKGDHVIVLTGDDAGKTGTITRVFQKKNQVLIEGVNKKIKHVKGRDGNPGERAQFFAPIHASNIAVLDKNGKPSRLGYKFDRGEKARYIKKSGEILTGKVEKKKAKTEKKSKSEEKPTQPIEA